jgi:anti-sigma factor ChrR (cupin superfamily)
MTDVSQNQDARDPRGFSCRWQESVALYLLGTLSAEETRTIADHLRSGCRPCNAERDELAVALAELDFAQVASDKDTTPPLDLKKRLMHKLAAESLSAPKPGTPAPDPHGRVWRAWTRAPQASVGAGLATVRASDEGWETIAVPGVSVKPLFVDPTRRYVTMLVRMAPGSSYPSHEHAGSEECYVLEGELSVGDRVLRAGDYQVASEGSLHGVQSTREGCLLFIVSSQDDRMV